MSSTIVFLWYFI